MQISQTRPKVLKVKQDHVRHWKSELRSGYCRSSVMTMSYVIAHRIVWWKRGIQRKQKLESEWQFMEFIPEHLAFYENRTACFSFSGGEAEASERKGQRRIEFAVITHN